LLTRQDAGIASEACFKTAHSQLVNYKKIYNKSGLAEKFVSTVKSRYKAFVGVISVWIGMDLVAKKAGCGYCK